MNEENTPPPPTTPPPVAAGASGSRVTLGDMIARDIFRMGDEPGSPCNRIQFMGGSWADDDECPQGGLCEAALAMHIDAILMKHQANDQAQRPR